MLYDVYTYIYIYIHTYIYIYICIYMYVCIYIHQGDQDFDIPMGCYDGAEICELVGIYIQNKFCKLMNKKDFGFYRDDGLGILRNTSGLEADQTCKSIIKIFKECGLSITFEVNKKIVDFLDVWLNLNEQTMNQTMNPFISTNSQTIHQT